MDKDNKNNLNLIAPSFSSTRQNWVFLSLVKKTKTKQGGCVTVAVREELFWKLTGDAFRQEINLITEK